MAINLAAFSRSLLESELFGYESGAVTGAQKKGKIGLFQIANHGTIFLDEIGDAPLDVQILLLRVLQSARPRCVGRGYLVATLEKDGVKTTEREIKGRLLQLQEQGLVRIGSTRQGTAVSGNGMELLSSYDDVGPS